MKIFGERLKELRAEKGLSSVKLGEAINVSNSSIIRWENDKNEITAPQLVALAKFFNVTTDYLLGLSEYR